MKLYILAIRDIKANVYMTPFFGHTVGAAVREFGDLANDKNHPIGKHPEDYELYELGWFGDGDAQFSLRDKPHQVAIASDFVNTKH